MKRLLLFLALATSLFAADVANDILMSQRKPDNSGNIQRNIPAQNAITSASLPSFQEAIGLGLTDSPTFAGVKTNSVTSLTGQALTLATLDSNANILLLPHGTGYVIPERPIIITNNPSFLTWQGTATLEERGLSIQSDGATQGVAALNLMGTSTQFNVNLYGGTLTTKTAAQTGTGFSFILRGYDGVSAFSTQAGFAVSALETWTTTQKGTRVRFSATPIATATQADSLDVYGDRVEALKMLHAAASIKRATAQFDKTDVTLADVTGLSVTLRAATSYRFRAVLFTSSNVGGGVKAAIASSGTVTTIIYEGFTYSAGTITQTRSTTSGGAVGAVTAITAGTVIIEGTITTNALGNLTVQFAANTAVGTSSVLVGSYLEVFGF